MAPRCGAGHLVFDRASEPKSVVRTREPTTRASAYNETVMTCEPVCLARCLRTAVFALLLSASLCAASRPAARAAASSAHLCLCALHPQIASHTHALLVPLCCQAVRLPAAMALCLCPDVHNGLHNACLDTHVVMPCPGHHGARAHETFLDSIPLACSELHVRDGLVHRAAVPNKHAGQVGQLHPHQPHRARHVL